MASGCTLAPETQAAVSCGAEDVCQMITRCNVWAWGAGALPRWKRGDSLPQPLSVGSDLGHHGLLHRMNIFQYHAFEAALAPICADVNCHNPYSK
ncbi:hypothetical protein CEXT_427071, partial [Caerostris extrusa]